MRLTHPIQGLQNGEEIQWLGELTPHNVGTAIASPLFRWSDTPRLADTGIELVTLVVSRYWNRRKWARQPARKIDIRRDAYQLLASGLFASCLAAVESWVIDRFIPTLSPAWLLYAIAIAYQRANARGLFGVIAPLVTGGNIFWTEHYLLDRDLNHLADAAWDIVRLLWRMYRFDFGPNLLRYCINPLQALVYVWTAWTLFVFNDGLYTDAWDPVSTTGIGLALFLIFGCPTFLLGLLTRLPDANLGKLRRAALTVCGTEDNLFTHQPLKGVREIRLLQLLPRNSLQGDVIRAELLHVSLDSAKPYDCISYRWGDLSKINDSYILVEGKRFNCSPNVHRMLLDLVRSSERLVWIDLFCINQQDTLEKSSQVSMMKEIYRSASNVVAWLEPVHDIGPIQRQSSGWRNVPWNWIVHPRRSFAESIFIRALRMSRQSKGSKPLFLDDPGIPAMCDLFRNEWFHRAWIIQEVVMASRPPTVQYGQLSMKWSDVIMLAEIILSQGLIPHVANLSVAERTSVQTAVQLAKIVDKR
jgi:hypothetical protein